VAWIMFDLTKLLCSARTPRAVRSIQCDMDRLRLIRSMKTYKS